MVSFRLRVTLTLLVAILVIVTATRARATEPVALVEAPEVIDLAPHLDVLVDETGNLSLNDITAPENATRWRPCGNSAPTYGVTSDAFWFRFELASPPDAVDDFLIEIPYPGLDRVELYSRGRRQIAGDTVPYDAWPQPHRFPLFPLALEPGASQTFYLHVRTTGATQVDARLWRRADFNAHDRARELGFGIFYGTLVIMLLYNLFLYYSVRDRSYLSYVGYVAGLLGLTVSMDGTGYLYFWPGYPVVNLYAFPLFVALALAGGVTFALHFLAVRENLPLAFGPGVMVAGMAILAGLASVVSFSASVLALSGLCLVAFAFNYGVGILCWRRGIGAARFYLLGWTVLLVGLGILLADKYGFLPPSWVTETTLRIGAVFEVLIFSFALANRINELKRDRDAIEAMDRVKTRFFANVSHELRTPLMLVLSPIQSLLDHTHDAEPRALLETAQANARRLLRQVNMLLEVVRLDEGLARMRPTKGNLGQLLEEMAHAARPYAAARGIELRVEHLRKMHDSRFDAARTEIVVGNLLSNALKFSSRGGLITLRGLSVGKDAVAFEIEDTGPGIPASDFDRVFERFERGAPRGARHVEGTGLGLALVKELTEAQGGTVSLRSELGRGSVFRIQLPAVVPGSGTADEGQRSVDDALATEIVHAANPRVLLADVDEPRFSPGSVAMSQSDDSLPKVLVVDDHVELCAILAQALSRSFRVETALNGRAALEVARRLRPDAIVADVMMPEMDGLALLREVRRDPVLAATPYLLATAKADRDDALAGLGAGADDYIAKPFDVRELAARVSAHVRARQLQRDLDDRDTRLAEIGRMTGQIVHDLRNPLSSIVVLCDITASLVKASSAPPDVARNLAVIDQSATRIETLTQQILEYAKVSSLTLRLRPVRVGTFLRSLLRMWEPVLEKDGITLVTQVQLGDTQEVLLDADRFARAVDNLIANAKEAIVGMNGDKVPRKIEVRVSLDAGGLQLCVADTGPGIDDSVRETLFDPFVSSRRSRGSGLGLAIVAEVARAHGGSVAVESRGALGGSVFTLQVPGIP